MKLQKQGLAPLGLICITFLAAIQYVFLRNVPDTVPSFAFICVTNVIGLLILGIAQLKKLLTLKKDTLLKGVLLAVELTGFNFFLLLGSRNMDSVIISSVVSLYFVFVTPILLADIFFACYVITISILGKKEDSTQLTLSQMFFAALFAFAGWLIENAVSGRSLALPTQTSFWISAVFIGVFIRAIDGLV